MHRQKHILVDLRCPKGHQYKSLNSKMEPCPICYPKPKSKVPDVFKEKLIEHKEPL